MIKERLLIIGYVWPEPKSSAAGSRMLQLITFFLSQGYKITFASPCAKSDNAFNLETIGVSQITIKLNHSSFDDFIKQLQPKIVLFDRFMMEEQFGWRIGEHCPNALRILDTEDLHCLRRGRQQAFKDKANFDIHYLFNETAKREIASIYRCDLSLIISEIEIELLKTEFNVPESLLAYVPFLLDEISNEAIEKLPNYERREHFISIGNFLHEPNYNAVLYLKETIWPRIRKQLPKTALHIYGAYVSQKVQQLHNEKQGFLVKGFAEDVSTVMQKARVCLAPIRFGAGLKGKLIDAMQYGTPCVTTKIGAEGMFGALPVNGFVEDNAQMFANKSVELYKNQEHWNKFQNRGFKVINERFNKVMHQEEFSIILEKTIKELKEKRLNNFTGLMLQHHTMQSTKFMSKWIEEKHKNE